MRFLTSVAFLASTLLSEAFAAGGGGEHHASIADLLWPTINVGILFGVLIWKVKKPLNEHFVNQSEEIANTLERASLKSKEAQIMLESEERKAANLNNEVKNIHQQAENDVMIFEKKLSKETEEKTQKLKVDASSKINADKKAMIDELNDELLNQVILKTKSTIKGNKDYQTKVSSKLLQGL